MTMKTACGAGWMVPVVCLVDRLLRVLTTALVEGEGGGVIGRANHLLPVAVTVALVVDRWVGY